jgi:GT2 family glycosyltransferase
MKVFNKKQKFITYNWNVGARLAEGEYVAFLNNDITVSKNWDVYLMNALNKNIWVANPYQKDNEVTNPYGKSIRTGSIDIRGSGFMMKKSIIKKIGYFPECLKHWYSDWWLGWVIKNKYNKDTTWVPDSLIHHYGSKSSYDFERRTGRLRYIIEEDRIEFQKITGLDGYLPKQ